jgi:beta-glucosidase
MIEALDFSPQKGWDAAQIDAAIEGILTHATLAEKVAMMSGHGFFKQFKESGRLWGASPYQAGAGCERLGVPALYFTDGPRGVARGQSTCFPCTMARGATFDTDLERRIGEAMAIEARAQGCTLSGAVCINLLRHPGWGRAQETYGEDPHHLGEMGAALAQGLQTHNVIATLKHFALNSIENSRFRVDVRIDMRALHEVYLPHFKRVLAAGCASVMSAYNKVNGEYCGQNRFLLTQILRHQWGFDGFVHSDWVFGVHKPYGAAAGLDIENPEPRVFGQALVEAVEQGLVEPAVIDQACRRILRTLYRFACGQDPLAEYPSSLVASPAHQALALEAAQKSMVLLKNEGGLPLRCADIKKLAVLGSLSRQENLGDNGSSRVRPPACVTFLEGISAALGEETQLTTGDEHDLAAAQAAAAGADAVVVVVGYTAQEEGEYIPGDLTLGQEAASPKAPRNTPRPAIGGDRRSLELPQSQCTLIEAVCAVHPCVIVVLVAGSAVLVEHWIDQPAALLQSFYPGMAGGTALAQILFGECVPSGKLPFSVARSAQDYPFFDPDADSIVYDAYHGYMLLEKKRVTPRFCYGYGLSYTHFSYRALKVRQNADRLDVQVSVLNTGNYDAQTVVQIYVGAPGVVVEQPQQRLRAFTRVALARGECKTVYLTIVLKDLYFYDINPHSWQHEPGLYRIYAGGSLQEALLLCQTIYLV